MFANKVNVEFRFPSFFTCFKRKVMKRANLHWQRCYRLHSMEQFTSKFSIKGFGKLYAAMFYILEFCCAGKITDKIVVALFILFPVDREISQRLTATNSKINDLNCTAGKELKFHLKNCYTFVEKKITIPLV